MSKKCLLISAILILLSLFASAEDNPRFSIKAGIGTDINLGIATGGGLGFLMDSVSMNPLELGIDYYYYHGIDSSKEQVGSSLNTYNDTTTLRVYAVSANFLHGYQKGLNGFYLITGIGAGAVSVDWILESPQDTSYNDSGSFTGGGLLMNLGVSYAIGRGFEIRLLAPILMFQGPQDSVAFAPMLNLAAAMRF